MKAVARALALLPPLLFAATLAGAQPSSQTLWKVVDKNGKVTYYDKEPPAGTEGTVTRIEMNLEANRAAAPKAPAKGDAAKPSASGTRRAAAEADLAKAEARLDAARKALAEGSAQTDADTQWMGNVKGGARPAPTEEYKARVSRLQAAVKAAEADVERARKAVRQAGVD
jgi:colicin import membrane protein